MSKKNTRRRTLRDWRSGHRPNKYKEELDKIRARLRHYEQCESLQQRQKAYCDLIGIIYEDFNSWVRCEMPNGAKLTIYHNPLRHLGGVATGPIYGHVEYPNRKCCKLTYLTEPIALHLFNKLGEKIKELENKKE